jgi:MFS transporter, PAT family, beta-lactamase induction signal transducer AmpG
LSRLQIPASRQAPHSSTRRWLQHAAFWVPSLYLAMGIPYNVINGTAVRMYKSLGYSDSAITVAVGSIGVAWSLKPLWAAFLDMYRTKKFFVLTMEWLSGLLFAAIAMALSGPGFFGTSIALLWVAAFASSTQDICADGVYLESLDKPAQARYAGLQGAFWVLGKVLATGVFISVLDAQKTRLGWSEPQLWRNVMLACAASMALLALYHHWRLPGGSTRTLPEGGARVAAREFLHSAATFFDKRAFWGMIAFVFLYRLGEGLILMEGQLFLQGDVAHGGLGLSAGQASQIDAIYGTLAGIAGGLIGGWTAGRFTLQRSLWVLALALNVPHFTYVYLSQVAAAGHGVPYATVAGLVILEKFGYSFGMVGNMIYMMQQLAPGRSTMTHYAFATSLMNLMLVPTAMISGPLAERFGFATFFVIVMFASVPSVWAAWRAPFPLSPVAAVDAQGRVVTADDATQLTLRQRRVQRFAARASIHAMLQLLTILVVDTRMLGQIQESAGGGGAGPLATLALSTLFKLWLCRQAWRWARLAMRAGGGPDVDPYRRNARGALAASAVSLAATVAVLLVGWRLAH